MKILMVLDEEFPPDVRVEKEIRTLQQAGHLVHLLCYSRSGIPGHQNKNGIDIFRISISPFMYKFKALALLFPFYFSFWSKHIQQKLKNEKYDVLHFHDLPLAKVCIRLARQHGLKVIGDFHENRPEIMKLYDHVQSFPGNLLISLEAWQKYQVRHSRELDALILVTQEARNYYTHFYNVPDEKITVVENFPDINELKSYPINEELVKKYKGKKIVLYFGDTGSRRGTFTLLEAANQLKKDLDFLFVIIGSSREQKSLIEFCDNHSLTNVVFTGEIPLGEAVSYFKSAHIGVCPFLRNVHHDTTYANKMFQYMAFGLPVVVSNCTAQENVVRESECGLVHQAGDAGDLVAKLKALDQVERYDRMSKNALESVIEKYNFDISKKKLLNLYKNLSDEN